RARPDPERVLQLTQARERVERVLDLWEGAGPIASRPPAARLASLREVLDATLERFANPNRYRERSLDARAQEAWTAAALGVREACLAVLERWERAGRVPHGRDPSTYLHEVEKLLGAAQDGEHA